MLQSFVMSQRLPFQTTKSTSSVNVSGVMRFDCNIRNVSETEADPRFTVERIASDVFRITSMDAKFCAIFNPMECGQLEFIYRINLHLPGSPVRN